MFGANFLLNIGEEVAMLLFGIGFANLLFQKNLIKKIIGLNIMDTAIYLFLAEKGYISGRVAPIIVDGIQEVEKYIKGMGKTAKPKKKKNESLEAIYESTEEKLKNALGTKVQIISKETEGSGKIDIEFYSHDDFERIVEKLLS